MFNQYLLFSDLKIIKAIELRNLSETSKAMTIVSDVLSRMSFAAVNEPQAYLITVNEHTAQRRSNPCALS